MESIDRLSRIVISDLFDFLELFHQARLADIDSDLMHPTMKQRDKCQCENAVERMYTEHLVCPMAWRGEADEVGIFHVPEGSLDVVLPAIAKYDLFVGKILTVSEQNPLAKDTFLQLIVGFVIGSKFNPKPPVLVSNLAPKKLANILAGDDRIQVLLNTLLGIGLAFPAGFIATGDTSLKIAQCPELLGQMLPYATDLAIEQSAASGNDDGALLPKHLFLGAINPNAFEERAFEMMKAFQGNVQKILVLCGNKRANEMVGRSVQGADVLFGVVPFIENQGNTPTLLLEHLVAGNQIVQNPAESDGVVLVSFIDLGEQRDMKIPRNQKRQANDAKIGAFGLGMAPLGQLGGIVRGKEGVEVGGVVKERSQINVESFDQSPRNVVFDLREGRLLKVVHVIPKALTAQGRRAERKKPDQNRIPIPGGEFTLARRRKCAIKGGQEHVLPDGSSLIPFRRVAVDRANDVQLPSSVPEGRSCSKITLLGVERASRSLGQEFEQLLSGAEMAQNADSRLSAFVPIGFDDAPVMSAANGIVLEARHDSYIPHLAQRVNRKLNML